MKIFVTNDKKLKNIYNFIIYKYQIIKLIIMVLYVTILAGGLGKRMQSDIPKVLHKVNGIPMIVKIIYEVFKISHTYKIIIVVGKYRNIIEKTISEYIELDKIIFVNQLEPLGTGNAVLSSLLKLPKNVYNLIINGDMPLIKNNILSDIFSFFRNDNKIKLMITYIEVTNPDGYGRIIIKNNKFERIVEDKDCSSEEKKIKNVNTGIYIASSNVLHKYIPLISNSNIKGEYYLTDLVEIYKNNENKKVGLFELNRTYINNIINVNTPEELAFAESLENESLKNPIINYFE